MSEEYKQYMFVSSFNPTVKNSRAKAARIALTSMADHIQIDEKNFSKMCLEVIEQGDPEVVNAVGLSTTEKVIIFKFTFDD